jgi:hypothetical protein
MSWLTYSNQGATRNQPLSADLVKAMAFLEPMGIRMDVYSGGQDATGPRRTGSHRHDYGKAGDVKFYKGDRALDWANPEDVPIYQDIVRQAKAAGVTGFGAGPGYMGAGTMHLGFGTPAVWGKGGSSKNAPQWLQAAYHGSPEQASASASPNLVFPNSLETMKPEFTPVGDASTSNVPVKDWPVTGAPPGISITVKDEDKDRDWADLSKTMALMAQPNPAGWDWVREAMRPRYGR